jgi:hypothetical protein
MITLELKTVPDLKAAIKAAFPRYARRKALVSVFHPGVRVNSYWSGGSRSEFAVVELETLTRHDLPTASHPYFDIARRGLVNATTKDGAVSVDHVGNVSLNVLPDGFVLVEAGTFCGEPAIAHVFVPASNMPKFLTA